MSIRRIIMVLVGVLALTLGLGVAGPGSASGAGGCWGTGPSRPKPNGIRIPTKYCNAYKAGDVFGSRYSKAGYLNAGTSWFVCQAWLPEWQNPVVGNARNVYWLWTQADKRYTSINPNYPGYGWFPATFISGGGNYQPIPGLPTC